MTQDNVNEIVRGYKGFFDDLTCFHNFQFEIGKEYEHTGDIALCEKGFHFCERPMDVFAYYPYTGRERYCIVEGSGDIIRSDDNSKVVCSKIKIVSEISYYELIDITEKEMMDNDHSTIMAYDRHSVAVNVGHGSMSCNISEDGVAVNTGYASMASTTEASTISAVTNGCACAKSTGYYSITAATRENSYSYNRGRYSMAVSQGDLSIVRTTGPLSMALSGGKDSLVSVEGDYSIAFAAGNNTYAKGALGCWLVLTEYEMCKYDYIPVDVKAFKVDGVKIKADTYYRLSNGFAVEVTEI